MSDALILRELARVKATFQLRAITAAMGIHPNSILGAPTAGNDADRAISHGTVGIDTTARSQGCDDPIYHNSNAFSPVHDGAY